jgi:hypothetical protein
MFVSHVTPEVWAKCAKPWAKSAIETILNTTFALEKRQEG